MATVCKWKPCEEPDDDAAFIVRFSNGLVKKKDSLDFKLLRHVDGSNPRKKSRRMVVAESERMSYVGNNFSPDSLQCNKLCRYFVGILDKTTMNMKVQRAEVFNLHPIMPGEKPSNQEQSDSKSYRDKVDALIEAFGTTKQKRALNSRRMNVVGSDTLQKSVATAARNIIDQKGIEALQQEVSDAQAQTETALFLPLCDKTATNAEDVYPFHSLLPPVEFESLKHLGDKMAALDLTDPKLKENGMPVTVLRVLKCLPKEEDLRDRNARCAWYLSFLIRLAREKRLERKLGEDECPRCILNMVQKTFTVEKFTRGKLTSTVTHSSVVKVAAHCLALLLHLEDQTTDLTVLHRDLSISENRMLEVAKAMGLTLSRQLVLSSEECGLQDEHRMVALKLPLVPYDPRKEGRKRKKMF